MAAPDWPSALRQRTASSAAPHRDRTGVEEVHIPPLVTVVEPRKCQWEPRWLWAETQITVLTFPDCSALGVNVVSLTPLVSHCPILPHCLMHSLVTISKPARTCAVTIH